MKWGLNPTNIFWIVGHIAMLALGIFLTVIGPQSLYKDVFLGVGGSLIAAGIAGEILFLYVAASQQTKDRLDLISAAGLQRIFATRSVSIRDEYHSRLSNAKEVDILGFGLASFREDYGNKFSELSLKTTFRILLLDPTFPSPENSIASIRDREEGHRLLFMRHGYELRNFRGKREPYNEDYELGTTGLLSRAIDQVKAEFGVRSIFFVEDTSVRIEAFSGPNDFPGLAVKEWFPQVSRTAVLN